MAATPILDQTNIHQRFVRRAGIAYGLMFALGFSAFFWGFDALALQQAGAHWWWAKLLLGLVICLPLSMLIGWWASGTRWSGISILLWVAGSAIVAWVAGHMPYEGLSWMASLGDPYPTGQLLYPMSLPAAGATGVSMFAGAIAGLFVGILSIWVIERAWNYSTEKHRLSVKSIIGLGACLPVILVFSLVADSQINAIIRDPFVAIAQSIKTTLDPSHDPNATRLFFFKQYQDRLTPHFTTERVSASPELENTAVDIQFDSGLLLRCRYSFGSVSLCSDIGQDLHDWMTQLMSVGHITCTDCTVQVERTTRSWLAALLPALDKLHDVKQLQHQGSWVYERATFESGRRIDCRFVGSAPVAVDLCLEAK